VTAEQSPWAQLAGSLLRAGEEIDGIASPEDDLARADGHAQLGTLLETALRWYLRGADPEFPRFVEINDTPEIADNLFAAVRGDATYRIVGNVSSLFDLNISIHTEWGWLAPAQISGDLGRDNLEIAGDGSFSLVLGGAACDGNWLPLPPDAKYVQIREYHADYAPNPPGRFVIERLGGAGTAPPRLTLAYLTDRLNAAAEWARSYMSFHQRSVERIFPSEANAIAPPSRRSGGNSHIHYGFGRFALEPGETLVVSFDQPRARLWSIQWLLAPWYENPDLANRQTGLPGGEAFVNCDGRVRVVISQQDPGVGNWLDCGGYAVGLFVTRWLWCDDGPEVSLERVPLSALSSVLPDDTPRIGAAERATQLGRRRMHFAARRR